MPRPYLQFEIDGVRKTLPEWCEQYGKNLFTVRSYLAKKDKSLKEVLELVIVRRNERNKVRPDDTGEKDSQGRSPTRQSYRAMLNRCSPTNKRHRKYYYYLGIVVCERWLGLNGFDNFLEDMGPRPEGKYIERKEQNGNYCKENCRWASHSENMRNQRSNVTVEYKGSKLTLAELSEITGIKYGRLRKRIQILGWTVDQAISEPAIPGISLVERKLKCYASV